MIAYILWKNKNTLEGEKVLGILQELNFLETEKSLKHIKQNGWNQGERSCRLLACHLK